MNIERPDDEMDFGDELETEISDEAPAPAAAPAPAPAAAAPAPAAKPIPQTIPYERFAEVNDARKRAEDAAAAEREARIRMEEQLRMAQAQPKAPAAPPAPAVDERALIKQRNTALLEGDDDKVMEIEAQLEAARSARAEERALARLRQEQAEAQAAVQATELQQVALQVVQSYPFLNSDSPEADRDAIEDVLALRDRNIARGMSQAAALQKAVERYKPLLDAKLTPAQPAAAPETSKVAESKLRNARAAAAQPPSLDTGLSPGAAPQMLDVEKMSREEWAALPEAERMKYLV